MALASTTIVEVELGGSDTANGGTFNPGATLTADGAATLANTASPVFTSASYNFVSGDVGAWLFIKSGTNWTPGWYQIASVASNAATLTATIGTAILYGSNALATGFNTVAGCATTASPTAASWTVDYSRQTAAQFSLTGLTTSAANAIILTTSATNAWIGNGIVITGGTNFTTGYYQITAVTAGVSATVDRTCSTAAGAAGTAGLGGAFGSPGMAGSIMTVAGMTCMIKYNASVYSASTASTNVSGGGISPANRTIYCGYSTSRWLYNTDTRPTFQIASGTSSASLISNLSGPTTTVINLICDGNNQTSSTGIYTSGTSWNCKVINCTSVVFGSNVTQNCYYCEATSNTLSSVVAMFASCICFYCEAHGNTGAGFGTGPVSYCLSYGNSYGYYSTSAAFGCVAYGNVNHGFDPLNNAAMSYFVNCISENNGGYGYFLNTNGPMTIINCSSYNNTSGRTHNAGGLSIIDVSAIQTSSSAFTNPSSSIFTLNNTAGAGALLRAAGFPSLFPAGLTADYADVGAAQSKASGGGGSGGAPILQSAIIQGLGVI